jgi:hypothetical protein|tara:strand:- start:570 stop:785 length:216 start_codon:yes stop_codon:yes gene_type:complete
MDVIRTFRLSIREQYIVAQALHVAIKEMGAVEPAIMREESNIADMKLLRETHFDFPAVAFEPVPMPTKSNV